jgi:hypothetical protein
MKRREPVNNLWMLRAPAWTSRFIHSPRLQTTRFVPIQS